MDLSIFFLCFARIHVLYIMQIKFLKVKTMIKNQVNAHATKWVSFFSITKTLQTKTTVRYTCFNVDRVTVPLSDFPLQNGQQMDYRSKHFVYGKRGRTRQR